jgi:hypothetical protein
VRPAPGISAILDPIPGLIADELGGDVIPLDGDWSADLIAAFAPIQLFEALRAHRELGTYPGRLGDYGADVAARLQLAQGVTEEDHRHAMGLRERGRADVAALFEGSTS